MEHHAPHPSAKFEGWYSKFDLQPSGSSVTIVVCTVPNAKKRPHVVSFTYVRKNSSTNSTRENVFQREIWADDLQRIPLSVKEHPDCDRDAFELRVPGVGYVRCLSETRTIYDLSHEDFEFHAETSSRLAWHKGEKNSTPAGLMVRLPLPLHWHVQSLASSSSVKMGITPSYQHSNLTKHDDLFTMLDGDRQCKATVHQEKNWARSFPQAHMWVQASRAEGDGKPIFCCAGGKILGMTAFLVGYRSESLNISFGPPFALNVLGIGPFLSARSDWQTRTFFLETSSLWWKICVKARAPEGSFFGLTCPFPEGLRENYLGQSFSTSLSLQIHRRRWTGSWELVREEEFEGASLEFGGAYYPPAGSQDPFN